MLTGTWSLLPIAPGQSLTPIPTIPGANRSRAPAASPTPSATPATTTTRARRSTTCANRYYNPELARFLTTDSAPGNQEDPATLNRYAYALDNPLTFSDPTGFAVDSEDDGGGELPDPPAGEEPPVDVPGLPNSHWEWRANPQDDRGGSFGFKFPGKANSSPMGAGRKERMGQTATGTFRMAWGTNRYDRYGRSISAKCRTPSNSPA